ncbi:MAG: ATP-binding cassette domain-containing protein, partial [Clostridium sp.]|nr:ATP-binding cassette domain-containing protein [Clostridium sp.]
MGNHLLEIENLQVQYNTDEAVVHAVNGLTLTLDKGEALGVVGETGAGKSTTALSILKLLPAKVGEITGGKIHYDGID